MCSLQREGGRLDGRWRGRKKGESCGAGGQGTALVLCMPPPALVPSPPVCCCRIGGSAVSVPVVQRVLLVYSECEQGRCMQRRVDEPRLPRSQGPAGPGWPWPGQPNANCSLGGSSCRRDEENPRPPNPKPGQSHMDGEEEAIPDWKPEESPVLSY